RVGNRYISWFSSLNVPAIKWPNSLCHYKCELIDCESEAGILSGEIVCATKLNTFQKKWDLDVVL
ncbi:hypothetical protein, partial [Shewanella holmiensis]